MIVDVYEGTNPIHINIRGVRQGDTIFPKKYLRLSWKIFSKLFDWENMGININGERLNNLCFADDVVLVAENVDDLKTMLLDLVNAAQKYGLHINSTKTNI